MSTDLPRTAAALKVKAEQAGWTVRITESAEHDSVALRLSRGTQRAAAVWEAGKFRSAFILGRLHEPASGRRWPLPRRLGARDLAKVVEG